MTLAERPRYGRPGSKDHDQEGGTEVFCTRCGQQNPDGARFCARCGAPLPAAGSLVPSPVDTTSTITLTAVDGGADTGETPQTPLELPPAGSALLVVRRGPNAGSRFLLDTDVTTAGRHPESDIFLDDVTVSRRHAEFVREQGGFRVRDVGSLNGTYLGRQRIDAPVRLTGGDEVQIGKYRLVFLAGS